jgi:sulfotransferase family protein
MEAAIAARLPGAGGTSARPELLAKLADYSSAAVREARELGAIVPSADECDAALSWLLRPVLICGHQRSGTTLLQNLLDGHPQLLLLPSEGTYFTSFAYVARAAPSENALDRFAEEWIARLVDPNFAPHFRLGKSDSSRNPAVAFARALFGWHAALRTRVEPKLAALLAVAAAFKSTAAPRTAPAIWVEKTPQNERHTTRFAPLERARFIQLVRDPRATFASLAELYRSAGSGAFDAAEHARSIGRSLRLASVNARRLAGRYLVVRYEDLIARPADEIERVRRFLDVPADPALLVPTAGGQAVRANSSFRAGAAGAIDAARSAPALPPEHLDLLGAHASRAARALGYDLPPVRMRWTVLLRDWPRHALRRSRAALRAVVPAAATRR